MQPVWIAFVVGLFLGVVGGDVALVLCMAAKRDGLLKNRSNTVLDAE